MKYYMFSRTAPAIPKPSKVTESCKFLLSQASKGMHEMLVPMFFPILGAHICAVEFQYPNLIWKESCGIMANLMAEIGSNKLQLRYNLVSLSNT